MIFTLLNEYNHLDNLTRLKMVICGQLEVDMELVTLDASFEHDLGADSLEVVELVIAIELEFGLEIDDSLASEIYTVRDALRYIER